MSLVIDYSNGVFEATPSGETVGSISGNATLDLTSGNVFSHTPTANTTFAFSNPPASGTASSFTLKLTGANVTSGYDLANASYDSKSFSVRSEDVTPLGLAFKYDGTKMYMVGASDTVFQYSLSTAWDVSTASYDSVSFSTSQQTTTPMDIQFKPDGTKMFVGDDPTDDIFQYTLSTPWDISSASYDNVSFSTPSNYLNGFFFNGDGTKVYFISSGDDKIYERTLSTAYDLSSTVTGNGSLTVQVAGDLPTYGAISSDGLSLFVGSNAYDRVYEWSLTSANDITTATSSGVNFLHYNEESNGYALQFKTDGTKMYVLGTQNDTVFQYSTAAAAALATITWPSSVKWAGGTAPTAPANGETDVYTFYTDDGGTTYYGFQVGDALA
jgi:hypothetical protein